MHLHSAPLWRTPGGSYWYHEFVSAALLRHGTETLAVAPHPSTTPRSACGNGHVGGDVEHFADNKID